MDTTIEIMELAAFVAVVQRGTFTAAAEALDTDKAHVSRIISRLENKLGAQLLQRSTRRLSVTETGRDFYERAAGILTALEESEASVARAQREPTGSLRLSAGAEFGMLRVNRWIASYLKTYPDVRVDAEFTNRVTDVIHEGIDIAIRIGTLPDSELSVRKLGEVHYAFYASPSYLKGRKQPKVPADLKSHDLVMFAPRGRPSWKVVKGRGTELIETEPRYAVNNNLAARDMAIAGMGVTLLPTFMTADALAEGKLKSLLPGWERIPVPVHAVFASSRYMAPKVRAFIDLAIREFKAES